jgi:hypothetical protein
LIVKGYVDNIRIYLRSGEEVACHIRNWGKEHISYNPLHYLPLLERKPGALDYAAPLFGFELPECFERLRRKLEAQKGHAGTKDYIQILRLIESHSIQRVRSAVRKALDLPYPSPDIVRLYCLPEESPEAPLFCLDGRERLRGVKVSPPDVSGYGQLLSKEDVA